MNPIKNEELATIIDRLEKNGASWEDRARATINFLENKKRAPENPQSTHDPAAEPLPQKTDPAQSGGEAARSGEHAARSGEEPAKPGEQAATSAADPAKARLADAFAERRERSIRKVQRSSELFEPSLDFREYLDKRSALDRLTADQRDAIGELLDDYPPETVQELLAKPIPKGLGIDFTASSLRRFYKRHQRRRHIGEQRELHDETRALLAEPGAPGIAFLKASERLLKVRLLKTTADSDAKLDTVEVLTRVLNALRKQALAERRQRHLEEKQKEPDHAGTKTPSD